MGASLSCEASFESSGEIWPSIGLMACFCGSHRTRANILFQRTCHTGRLSQALNCMRLLLTSVLAFSLSGYAVAQTGSAQLDAYLDRVTGRPPHEILAHIAEAKSSTGEVVFGLVQVPLQLETEDSTAFIFVGKVDQDNSLVELVRSKPFPFWSAGRHYVEIVQAPSSTRFTVQINYRGACTAGYEVFRFAQRGQQWIAAGRDTTWLNCGADDQSSGDSRRERSANFLSGTIVEVQYHHGRVKSRRTKHETFPIFLVADFDPFKDTYGPR